MNEKQEQTRIRELIDACRPGHDDLTQGEFQELAARIQSDRELDETFERSQQLDGAIARAMVDVEVPAGLADRLLDVFDVAETQEFGGGDHVETSVHTTRRRWLTAPRAAILGGVAAVIAILALVQFAAPDPVTQQQLARYASEWTIGGEAESYEWRSVEQALPKYPDGLPRRARLRPQGWRAIEGSTAACYDLLPGDNGQAVYLVVWPNREGVGFSSSPTLVGETAGWCIAVWSKKGHLYALVIRGGERRFRRLVPSAPTV